MPATDGVDREFGRVVVDADADQASIGGDVVDPVGHDLAKLLVGEVVDVDRLRAALRPVIAARVLEIADQFLLLGIDGDHRLIGGLEGHRLCVDVLELAVAVGMVAPFLGLSIDLPAVLEFAQQLGDAAWVDRVPHCAQRFRKFGVAFRHPQQRPHRIAHRRRLEQPAQILQQRRVRRRQGPPPTTRAPNRSLGKSRRGQIFQPAIDRTSRDPRHARHGSNAPVTRRLSLHRRKQAPPSFIKAGTQSLVSGPNSQFVYHAATIPPIKTLRNPPRSRPAEPIHLFSGLA